MPLRHGNPHLRAKFRNFIILTCFLFALALIDGVINMGKGYDSLFSTFFSCYMAAAFLFLVTRLWSPHFNKPVKTLAIGFVFFYAACMPVFSNIQEESPLLISAFVIIIFGFGKFVFGDLLNGRMIETDDKDKNQMSTYFKILYKNWN